MAWKVRFRESALKDLERRDRTIQRRIIRFLKERIATSQDPRRVGKGLSGKLAGLWRYRVGDYRIICLIEDEDSVVEVVVVGHRSDIYQ